MYSTVLYRTETEANAPGALSVPNGIHDAHLLVPFRGLVALSVSRYEQGNLRSSMFVVISKGPDVNM